jgi:hypothetical protein
LEASRLARNNRDWHHLIDLCVLTETIVVDAEGIYDPLALTQASEAEARLQAESASVTPLDEDQRHRLMTLGADLQKLWNDGAAPVELKKRTLRTVINEIVWK